MLDEVGLGDRGRLVGVLAVGRHAGAPAAGPRAAAPTAAAHPRRADARGGPVGAHGLAALISSHRLGRSRRSARTSSSSTPGASATRATLAGCGHSAAAGGGADVPLAGAAAAETALAGAGTEVGGWGRQCDAGVSPALRLDHRPAEDRAWRNDSATPGEDPARAGTTGLQCGRPIAAREDPRACGDDTCRHVPLPPESGRQYQSVVVHGYQRSACRGLRSRQARRLPRGIHPMSSSSGKRIAYIRRATLDVPGCA
jgi:hypothetical protein